MILRVIRFFVGSSLHFWVVIPPCSRPIPSLFVPAVDPRPWDPSRCHRGRRSSRVCCPPPRQSSRWCTSAPGPAKAPIRRARFMKRTIGWVGLILGIFGCRILYNYRFKSNKYRIYSNSWSGGIMLGLWWWNPHSWMSNETTNWRAPPCICRNGDGH